MTIKYKRLKENAVAPTKAHPTDAGLDLTAVDITTEINECGELILVYHTGLAIEIPEGYFGMLTPRSSISKKSLELVNSVGVIDSDYRGEVMAKFRATTSVVPAVYKVGERICQLLILPVPDVQLEEAEQLTETDRGEGGFGSTDSSAPTGSQSLPENEGQPTNSETANDGSGWAENSPEQVQ